MKKKLLTYLTLLCFIISPLFIVSCEYDDGPIKERLDKVENDVSELQKQAKEFNQSINSLKDLVDILNSKDQIEKIETFDGGIKLIMKSGGTHVIENGKAPSVNVKKDETSGKYFWVVDGEFIKDGEGNKIAASSPNAPQIRPNVETGMFEIYFEEVGAWIPLGPGMPYNIFKDIVDKEDEVVFTMADGTIIKIPKTSKFIITLDSDDIIVAPNRSVSVSFTVVGGDAGTEVDAIGTGGYEAKVEDAGDGQYYLDVDVPSELGGKVIIIAVNSKGETAAKIVTFDEAVMEIEPDYIAFAPAEGAGFKIEDGSMVIDPETLVSVPYRTNLECRPYYDNLNDESWCIWANNPQNPMIPTTRAVPIEDKQFLFMVAPNDTDSKKFAQFRVVDAKGFAKTSMFAIVQLSPTDPPLPKDGRMDVETFNGGQYCYTYGDYSTNDGWTLTTGTIRHEGKHEFEGLINVVAPELQENYDGKPSILTSPLLSNGLTRLTIKWIRVEKFNGIQFKVNVLNEADEIIESKEIIDNETKILDPQTLIIKFDTEIKEKFKIQIINTHSPIFHGSIFVITDITWKPYINMKF